VIRADSARETCGAIRISFTAGLLFACLLCVSTARAQTVASLRARDAFTASLPAAFPALPLVRREISLRYGATKYYEFEPLQQDVVVAGVVPLDLTRQMGATFGTFSPDCSGCPRWYGLGIDYGIRIGPLTTVQSTASIATGFKPAARLATSAAMRVPVTKAWSHAFVSLQGGVALGRTSVAGAAAAAIRPTAALSLGGRARTISVDCSVNTVVFSARPPVATVRVAWRAPAPQS
jgi:hypothetical protein